MSKGNKIFTTILLVIMIFCCITPIMTFAASDKVYVTVQGTDIEKLNTAFEDGAKKYDCEGNKITAVSSAGSEVEIISWDEDGKLEFNATAFDDCDTKSKRTAMKHFVELMNDADVSQQTIQNVNDKFSEGSNTVSSYLIGLTLDSTSADLFTALKWVGPILQFLRIIIGIGVVCIILLLIFSTVMDCVYIGMPVWREHAEGKEGGGKPFGVSMEAMSTVKEVESSVDGGKYKNPYLLYFRRRATTYIILAICILYLIAGELSGVIQGLLNMVSGFTA